MNQSFYYQVDHKKHYTPIQIVSSYELEQNKDLYDLALKTQTTIIPVIGYGENQVFQVLTSQTTVTTTESAATRTICTTNTDDSCHIESGSSCCLIFIRI